MSLKYQSLSYQGGSPNIPDVNKDLYRSSDFIRDFAFQWQQAGRALKDLYGLFPLLVLGGYVTQGSSLTEIDITPAVGYVAFTVKIPTDYTVTPPTVSDEQFNGVRVESPQQTDLSISGATLDGVTTNYVKLQYAEAGVITRPRLKGSGSYVFEKSESYNIVVDDSATTNLDIVLAELVGDGSTFLTITNKPIIGLHLLFLDTHFQDDSRCTLPVPVGAKLYEFANTNLKNSDGEYPFEVGPVTIIDADSGESKCNTRGVLFLSYGYLRYKYSWDNQGTIKFRFKPDFPYTIPNSVPLVNSEDFSFSENFVQFVWDQGSDRILFRVQDDVSNKIEIWSNQYTSDIQLQVWADIVLTWDKSGNNIRFFIDGVEQGVGGVGIKTVTGAGITNIVMTATNLNINITPVNSSVTKFYLTDFLIYDTVDIDLTNYDGSDNVRPYSTQDRITGLKNRLTIDSDGCLSANYLSTQYLDNGSGPIRKLTLPIGPWNMDSVASVTVQYPVGVSKDNIRGAEAFIRNDTDTATLTFSHTTDSLGRLGGGIGFNASGIILTRVDNGSNGGFDNTNYDATTFNRGFVVIEYIENV